MQSEPNSTANDAAAGSDVKAQRGINALESTGELLVSLAGASQPLGLRDLAAAAGMPPAKAFPHLVSLLKIGLLSRDEDGCFSAGPLGFQLGLVALQRMSPTRDAEPEIASLAATTQLTVAAAALGPLGPTIIRLEESARPQHISLRVGTVMSLVNTSIGRVFAAHMEEDALERWLSHESIRLAGAQAEEPLSRAYRERLNRIRENGIDESFDAPVPGVGTVAAPALDHTGGISLVIALIGSSASFDAGPQGPVGRALLAATQRLSWRFGASGAATPAG
ncbi:IclR family transcriptional regulator [Paraburkholderia atlantica]|uniref:IclR family transcriptional regulator n=1 Tax=Paraburkholderia TaxID=1822464 RepID=UPI003D25FD21